MEIDERLAAADRLGFLARRRLEELGFKHLIFAQRDKVAAYEALRAGLGLMDEQVAYMGDDARGEYIYKFVSSATYVEGNPRANANILDSCCW